MVKKIKRYISLEEQLRYKQLIQEICTQQQLTFDRVAKDSGLSPATITRIMQGDTTYSLARSTIYLIRAFITKYGKDYDERAN